MTNIIWILYKYLLKPILFLFDPEDMHDNFSLIWNFLWKYKITKYITNKIFYYKNNILKQEIFWIIFENPIWLSAWFDKDIKLCDIVYDIWFGFEEVWSITKNPYWWNLKPRLHRIKKSEWLIVNYGLKNKWVDKAIDQYKTYNKIDIPIWISIAKTNCKETCNEEIWIEDFIYSLNRLNNENIWNAYVLNISCPNSFGWENFASPNILNKLLENIRQIKIKKPILIKMPIDKDWNEINELLKICIKYNNVKWVILSNLIKDRSNIIEKNEIENIPWWISGRPTYKKSNELISQTYKNYWNKLIIVWVWWIFCAEDAYEKIKLWASLVELITWMIYKWPQLIWEMNEWISELLKKDWYSNISQAIWSNHKISL